MAKSVLVGLYVYAKFSEGDTVWASYFICAHSHISLGYKSGSGTGSVCLATLNLQQACQSRDQMT